MSAKAFDSDSDVAHPTSEGAFRTAGTVTPINKTDAWTKEIFSANRLRDKLRGPQGPAPDNIVKLPVKPSESGMTSGPSGD